MMEGREEGREGGKGGTGREGREGEGGREVRTRFSLRRFSKCHREALHTF
jgi:hypothetical protein